MSRLTRDGTVEPVSRDQILRRERGQGNNNFSCSADHEQDWQPHPVDPYNCYMCDHTVSSIGSPGAPASWPLLLLIYIYYSRVYILCIIHKREALDIMTSYTVVEGYGQRSWATYLRHFYSRGTPRRLRLYPMLNTLYYIQLFRGGQIV